ncbi:MAG: sporulation protein YqfD [Clostridia bacterium]|nr:sporulation protein YqfD [Clostridia bacterium]
MMGLRFFLPDRRCVLLADSDCVNCVLDYGIRKGKFVHAEREGDNTVILVSTELEAELRRYLASNGVCSIRKRSWIYKYRKRIGLLIGGLLAFVLINYFSSLLWVIDVTGNSRLTDEEIKDILSVCGVYEGIRIRDIDNDATRIKAMSISKEIAWMSVNVHGMRAEVIVSEAERVPEKDAKNEYSHIVAAYDGIITGIVVERGQPMVKVGETVKKGDMLVSGIIEERDGDIRLTDASARVYAQTERVITVNAPYASENVTVKRGKMQSFSLGMLGKSIKFSIKYGLEQQECDIINKRGSICIFGGFRLPVYYTAKYSTEKSIETVLLTREDARRLAEEEAFGLLFSESDSELVSKRFICNYDDDSLTLTLFAVCEENIARSLPFTAEP